MERGTCHPWFTKGGKKTHRQQQSMRAIQTWGARLGPRSLGTHGKGINLKFTACAIGHTFQFATRAGQYIS